MANRRLRKEIREGARGLYELGAIDGKAMREFESLSLGRVVTAPAPMLRGAGPPVNRVLSEGGSYVSGYTIIATRPKNRRKAHS